MSKLSAAMRACVIFLVWATAAIALPAQTFTTLHNFDGTDGTAPQAALVQGTDGSLYGTTAGGGANNSSCINVGSPGCGTAFKITTDGTLTMLHSFDGTDGVRPHGLVQGTDGDFFGTTGYGGDGGISSYGTVFQITPSGALTTLYSFDNKTDGVNPSVLIQATDGNFYGTTYGGGTNGDGTVFRITPDGTLTMLHSFDGTDGARPQGALVQATDGNFYGTTVSGGSLAKDVGTVFQITRSGALTTLRSFDGKDGSGPSGGVIQATDGNFYGTTGGGGANISGTVFKITPGGTITTLYSFCSQSNCTDGFGPAGGLIQATDGNFYGTTVYGGTNSTCNAGCGTVFSITPNGTLTTLYSFCSQSNCKDGNSPRAALVQGTDGNFYGTASRGGAGRGGLYCCGTVFRLSEGLGSFVETNPASGKVGVAVKILGTNLTGATSVTFNGTAATFTVVSDSEITTTVPTGATTGTVQVVTPSGTLSSNVPFRVRP